MKAPRLIDRFNSILLESQNQGGYDPSNPYSAEYQSQYTGSANTTAASSSSTDREQRIQRHITRLNNIFQQLQMVAGQQQESINIYKELVESFGYQLDEQDSTWDRVKSAGGRALSKLALPVTVAFAVWEAWEQIEALPVDLDRESRAREIRTIITTLVAEYGTFWVGGIIGAAMAGTFTGPVGAFGGFMAGGFAAQYALGDTIDEIVDKIVDHSMEAKPPVGIPAASDAAPEVAEPDLTPKVRVTDDNADVIQLQQELAKLQLTGLDGNTLVINGTVDANTIAALQKLMNLVGQRVPVDGKPNPQFAAAVQAELSAGD